MEPVEVDDVVSVILKPTERVVVGASAPLKAVEIGISALLGDAGISVMLRTFEVGPGTVAVSKPGLGRLTPKEVALGTLSPAEMVVPKLLEVTSGILSILSEVNMSAIVVLVVLIVGKTLTPPSTVLVPECC